MEENNFQKIKIPDSMHNLNKGKEHKPKKKNEITKMQKITSWMGIIFFVFVVLFMFRNNASKFMASVIDFSEEHQPYNGLVMPIQKVPDWVHLSSSEYNNKYDEIPTSKLINLPEYDLDELKQSSDELSYENLEDLRIRNAKITYSVVYLGNYELDHNEGAGSHPAVDIKIPEGTPIYAIGNAVVEKASGEGSGFGKHVVLRHDNFPSPDNPNQSETLYSSYSHLSEILVTEGDVVSKGDKIGLSGQTGIATTPHLHFQIDNDNADWHPYWPFTYEESEAAGLSFFEAINTGLGKDKAEINTINPMLYLQQYGTYSASTDYGTTETEPEEVNTIKGFVIDHEDPFIVKRNTEMSLQAYGADGNILTALDFTSPLTISLKSSECGKLSQYSLEEEDFSNSSFLISLDSKKSCETKLIVNYNNEKYYTNSFEIIDEGEYIDFVPVYDELYVKGDDVVFYLKVIDKNGNLVKEPIFSDEVWLFVEGDIGELSKTKLINHDFMDGVAKIKLNNEKIGIGKLVIKYDDRDYATKPITVSEKIQSVARFELDHDGFFVEGVKEPITVKAISTSGTVTDSFETENAIELNITDGSGSLTKFSLTHEDFEDGEAVVYFTGNSTDDAIVTATSGTVFGESQLLRAELYTDIMPDNAYYTELKYLKDKGIFSGYPDGTFQCERTISRVETLKVILEALAIKLTTDIALPFTDTEDVSWYASYLATALNSQIVSGYDDNSFRPTNTINKAEFTKMLILALNPELKEVTKEVFPDVPKDAWFAKYVKYVSNANVMNAESDGLYHPENEFNRCEAARALYRVMKIRETGSEVYTD